MPPHDRLFKTLLRAFFADLLRLAATGVAAKASLARIVFLDKELLAGTGRREADLLARVPLVRGGSLLVHVEIEARARRPMPSRLRAYASRIQALYDGQVLSIVLYLKGGEPGVCWQELDGEVRAPEVTAFRYVAFGLAGCRAPRAPRLGLGRADGFRNIEPGRAPHGLPAADLGGEAPSGAEGAARGFRGCVSPLDSRSGRGVQNHRGGGRQGGSSRVDDLVGEIDG